MKNPYVNLGCGAHFHPDWVNVDLWSSSPQVMAHDLRMPLPFPDNSFSMVYHSHVIEHFTCAEGVTFLRECFRLLQPGGIVRIATPDMQVLAELYLDRLKRGLAGDVAAKADHRWLLLEIFDQMVRQKSGGEMKRFLGSPHLENQEFVLSRIGEEGRTILKHLQSPPPAIPQSPLTSANSLRKLFRSWRERIRSSLLRRLLGKNGLQALSIGTFRLSGEVHQVLYDQLSLGNLLQETGFVSIRRVSARQSSLPGWEAFSLDTLPDGTVRKPDSFFLEAIRP